MEFEAIASRSGLKLRISQLFSQLSGISPRRLVRTDCVHHHHTPGQRLFPLRTRKVPYLRAFCGTPLATETFRCGVASLFDRKSPNINSLFPNDLGRVIWRRGSRGWRRVRFTPQRGNLRNCPPIRAIQLLSDSEPGTHHYICRCSRHTEAKSRATSGSTSSRRDASARYRGGRFSVSGRVVRDRPS